MVFNRPEGVPPKALTRDRLLDGVGVCLPFAVGTPRRRDRYLVEQRELHGCLQRAAILRPYSLPIIFHQHGAIEGSVKGKTRMHFAGRTFVVTGASSGIGAACARRLHAEGAL